MIMLHSDVTHSHREQIAKPRFSKRDDKIFYYINLLINHSYSAIAIF